MEALFQYFLKVNGLLVVFYLAYYIFLRKETFFQSNRWFLLLGIASGFIFPLISFTNVIWIEPEPFVQSTNFYNPTTNFDVEPIPETFNWNIVLFASYILVSLFFLTRLTIEIFSFFKIIKRGNKLKKENIVLVETNENQNPFSFFNYLVFNKSNFTEEELNMILIHEKIHIQQKHSIDVLIIKLLCLLFWANPIIWLYRKAILENLEFIADNQTSIITNKSYQYQKTLLKVVFCNNQLSITNQFYQSLIKKRIVMLNTNPSSKKKLWKYSLVLPFLIGFIFLFQIETVAQIKESEKVEEKEYSFTSSYSSILTSKSSDEELKELEKTFSDEKTKLNISKVKRNKANEIIEIKLSFDTGKTYNSIFERKSSNPIDDIEIYVDTDKNNLKIAGFKEAKKTKNTSESVSTINNNSVTVSYDGWKIVKDEADKNPVLFVVNGTKLATGSNIQFDYTMKVLNSKELSEKEAVKKYGEVGKNGAYEFTIEKSDYSNQLYIINGKEYTTNDLKGKKVALEGSVVKLSDEEGKAKYGKKGRNGVSVLNGSAVITDDGKKDLVYIRSITKNSNNELPEPPSPPSTSSYPNEKLREAPEYPSNSKDEKVIKKVEVYEIIELNEDIKTKEEKIKLIEEQEKRNQKIINATKESAEKRIVIDKQKAVEREKLARAAAIKAETDRILAIKSQIEAEKQRIEVDKQKIKAEIAKQKAEELKRVEQSKKE